MVTRGIVLVAASALLLTGCATATADSPTDGRLTVVASTDVYGQIAETIGGDDVSVTSLITSASQDPHSFEPSAQDALAVSRAALVVENGGGYDGFMTQLIDSTGSTAPVITAVDLLGDHDEHTEADEHTEGADDGHGHIEGLNEHVWYDPHVVEHVAEEISTELSALRPDDADAFAANLADFEAGIADLETSLADLDATAGGAEIFVTEPVPLYLTDAAGLVNVAPEAFTEAVEEGQDVPPATLLEALHLLGSGAVRLVVVNAQTGGSETERVTDAADAAGIPVVAMTETLPDGSTYLEWMADNIRTLQEALAA